MRFNTSKTSVMFRPHDIKLFKTVPPESGEGALTTVGANVADKANLGWVVKYTLRFDDDVVRRGAGCEGKGVGTRVQRRRCFVGLDLLGAASPPTKRIVRSAGRWGTGGGLHEHRLRLLLTCVCLGLVRCLPLHPTNILPTYGLLFADTSALSIVRTHPRSQECELQLSRDQDEREYNLVVGSRVFVHVPHRTMMGFNASDVDSTPIV